MSRQKHDITAGGGKDCEIDILGGNDIIKGGCARQAMRKCKMQFLNKNLYGARKNETSNKELRTIEKGVGVV